MDTKIILVEQKKGVKNYCYKQKNLNKLKMADNQRVKSVDEIF
jgi:hypothetical protein